MGLDKKANELQNDLKILDNQISEVKVEISNLKEQAQKLEQPKSSTSTVDNKMKPSTSKKVDYVASSKIVQTVKKSTDDEQFHSNLCYLFLSLEKKALSNYLENYQKDNPGYKRKNLRRVIKKFEENLQKNIKEGSKFLEVHKNNIPNTQDKINVLIEKVYDHKKERLLQLCNEVISKIMDTSQHSNTERACIISLLTLKFFTDLNNILQEYFKENTQSMSPNQQLAVVKHMEIHEYISEIIKTHIMFLYEYPINNNIEQNSAIIINPTNLRNLVNSILQLIAYNIKPRVISDITKDEFISHIDKLKIPDTILKKARTSKKKGNFYDTVCTEYIKTINETENNTDTKQANLLYTICTQFIASNLKTVQQNYQDISISKIYDITNKVSRDQLNSLELSFLLLMKSNKDGKISDEIYNKQIKNLTNEIGNQCVSIINEYMIFIDCCNLERNSDNNLHKNDVDIMINDELLSRVNCIEIVCKTFSQEIQKFNKFMEQDLISSLLAQYQSVAVFSSSKSSSK